MKNKAFTLIEVLVVVLIIGILAAISVVQYQKSVLKSRFTALMPIAKALYEGNELFAMSSGKYTDKLENLDMSTTGGASGSTANINGSIVTLGVNNRHTYVKATRENFDNNLIMFQKGSRYFPGEIHCEAKEGKTLANWLCQKELGGEKLDRSLTEGYNDYVINGDGNGVFPKDFVDGTNGETLMTGDTCTTTITENTNHKCPHNFPNDTICYGHTTYGCDGIIFSNATCYAEGNLSCRNSTFSDNSLCVGNYGRDGSCSQSTFTDSTCEGNVDASCITNTFTNSTCTAYGGACMNSTYNDSVCYSKGGYGCSGSTFKGSSTCYGDSEYGCTYNTRGGKYNQSVFEDNSSCYGNTDSACKGITFKGNSICYANEDGACGGSISWYGNEYETTYEGNACCKGNFCPSNAPKCDCDIDSNTGQHALSC